MPSVGMVAKDLPAIMVGDGVMPREQSDRFPILAQIPDVDHGFNAVVIPEALDQRGGIVAPIRGQHPTGFQRQWMVVMALREEDRCFGDVRDGRLRDHPGDR